MIDDAIEIYTGIIDQPKAVNVKPFYDRFADYLVKWGFLEEARKVLSKKLRFGRLSMEEQRQTAMKMRDNMENAAALTQ